MGVRPAAAVASSLLLLLLLLALASSHRAAAAAAPSQQQALLADQPQQQQQQQEQQTSQAAGSSGGAAAGAAAATATITTGTTATATGAASPAAATPQPPLHVRPRVRPNLPELIGYNFNNSKDTFELCHDTAGLTRDIPLEELLPIFKLPNDLVQRKHTTLAELIEMLHVTQPDFKVVYEPMLFGEADIGSLLSPGGLPRLVHFTVKDKDKLKPHQVVTMASWAFFNPGHSLMLFDDDDVREFMTSYYPELLPTFDGLGSPVERTDMWRYLVLCRMGGVYADSDVVAARPVSDWVQDAGLLVGIENVFTTPEEAKRRDYTRQVQMVQWAIASRKGHPVVCRMGQYIAHHVKEEAAGEFVDPDRDHAILERTGPGIWSSSVHDYIAEYNVRVEDLVAGGKVGDVRVLPQPVFGCASATWNPQEDVLPYVYHMFKGSWKSKQPSKIVSFISTLYAKLHRQKKAALAGERAAALAAAAAAASEAAAFARNQQVKPAAPAAAAGAVQAAAAASSSSLHHVPAAAQHHVHPRLPVLDEQILEHKRQQQLQQEKELQQKAAAAAASGSVGPGTGAMQQQRVPVTLAAAAAGQQQAGAAAPAVTAADTRKLRSSQMMLVRGIQSPSDAGNSPLIEPELPSSAISSVPALSVLVLVLLLCAVYKQQQGSMSLLLGAWAGRAAGSSKGLSSSMRSSSSGCACLLSRPSSRLMLSAGGSSANVAAAAGSCGMARPPLPDRQVSIGIEPEVCYASSQQNGHPHRHKRSWGSSSNFQQL
jgi:hypothetical protein